MLQGRDLPLGEDNDQRVGFRQNRMVFSSKMHLGQMDSDSVWNLQLALIRHDLSIGAPAPTGNYLNGTLGAVKKFQLAQGWSGKGADGLAGKQTVKRLGLTWVAD